MSRKNVAQYQVGHEVSIHGRSGRWRIEGFPSRRLAVVRCLDGTQPVAASVTTVSLHDLTILQSEGGAVTRVRPRVLFPGGDTPTEQEERVARLVGGHRNRGSGASMFAKGDVIADRFLVECKRTVHASLSIKKAWLDKIATEAAAAGKEPALAIEIAGGPNHAHGERDWIAVPARVFRQLVGEDAC